MLNVAPETREGIKERTDALLDAGVEFPDAVGILAEELGFAGQKEDLATLMRSKEHLALLWLTTDLSLAEIAKRYKVSRNYVHLCAKSWLEKNQESEVFKRYEQQRKPNRVAGIGSRLRLDH